jgi:hypothetical protein
VRVLLQILQVFLEFGYLVTSGGGIYYGVDLEVLAVIISIFAASPKNPRDISFPDLHCSIARTFACTWTTAPQSARHNSPHTSHISRSRVSQTLPSRTPLYVAIRPHPSTSCDYVEVGCTAYSILLLPEFDICLDSGAAHRPPRR